MNKHFLLEQIKKRETFDKAYVYAISYRINQDSYCNFIEIDYYRQDKEKLFQEIKSIFENPNVYEPETAFSFYLPKSEMFFRRMIHTPFKDLVIKFIIVIILADLLDFTLVKNCFSYRLEKNRDKNKKSKGGLYRYYYEGFQEFIDWQTKQVDHSLCLLKTDISSFYDSISHEYLVSAISKQLSLPKESQFILIFAKTLKFKVCYYSFVDGKLNETYNSQGIPIGNEAEGFIANLFLKEVDEALFNQKINFGRYVDDFRIFAKSKNDAIEGLIILQEFLLKIGVNLNASKTKIIEAQEKIIEFIKESKKGGTSTIPFIEEEYSDSQQEKIIDKSILMREINSSTEYEQELPDKSISLSDKNIFGSLEEIDSEEKAKKFGKFLHEIPLGKKIDPKLFIYHIEWLYQLSKKYTKHSKLYAWLFVRFVSLENNDDIQKISLKYLFKVLDDTEIHTFIKTRIIHNLIKPRKGALTYIQRMSTRQKLKERFLLCITELIKSNCIALQLNCIYAYYLILQDYHLLQDLISINLNRPIPEPIQNAVYQIGTLYYKGSPKLPSFEEILEESEVTIESESFLFQ